MALPPSEMIVLAVIFSSLPLIVGGLRVWAHRIMNAKFLIDDYLTFSAIIICVALGIIIGIGSLY